MKHNKEKTIQTKWYQNMVMILFSVLFTMIAGYCYRNTYGEIIRNCVMSLLMVFLYQFTYEREATNNQLLFDNVNKGRRNRILYIIGIPVSCALALLPVTGWPYPLIFTIMALCTSTLPGIVAGTSMLMLTVIFSGSSYGVFCIYFIAGVISVLLFTDLGRSFHTILPIVIQTILYFFLLAFIILFYLTGPIAWESFLIPLFNIFINTILMMIVCRYYNYAYLEKEQNQYSLINDQTFKLLEKCKAEQEKEYFRAIHTSYFTQVIAEVLKANPCLCKGGGYYVRLAHFSKDYNVLNLKEIMSENNFPKELTELIMSCNEQQKQNKGFSSKEEFAVELSSSLIDVIMKDKEESKDIIKNYENNVKRLMINYYDHHYLDSLDLTFTEFQKLETALLKEKKYLQMM